MHTTELSRLVVFYVLNKMFNCFQKHIWIDWFTYLFKGKLPSFENNLNVREKKKKN